MDLPAFRVLSLCSGAGGLDLGLKLACRNARTVCYVEIEAFACEILARRCEEKALDDAPVWTDIRTFDGRPWRGAVDCVIGGYPCQPFSIAGHKRGTGDPRHLWPEFARIVDEVRPAVCFFENVANHLRLGFEQVADDLCAMGYAVKAGLFTAEEAGAPHRRERLFVLAHRDGKRRRRDGKPGELGAEAEHSSGGRGKFAPNVAHSHPAPLADRSGFGRQGAVEIGGGGGQSQAAVDDGCGGLVSGHPLWPPAPEDAAGWEAVPAGLEPSVCRMADGMADRVDRIRACGNGVVPLVAAYAWRALSASADLALMR